MNCFDHRETQAIGICRVCSKGLCAECAVDLGSALTCAGSCAEEARQINNQNQQARKALQVGRKNRYTGALFFAFIGTVLLIGDLFESGLHPSFLSVFGGGILFFSGYLLFASRELGHRTQKQKTQGRDEDV